ncbi:hypothetical protein GCM10007049_20650 [Echinicola pacifica]|uniref:Uncharacterized protein n=1 Tax=Echinicola pacifica TaxID=346377 RepID=A0A918PYY4_9BACT|nr:hypothetical protein [Echinicola pacifica]GGZ27672.1 hypothetical protein GCM10007049_20650 [Echinicola pacifica]
MNKIQLIFHHTFRFIWNLIFVICYPILATFGLVFIGLTYFFSWISRLLTNLRKKESIVEITTSEWKGISGEANLLECKQYKQIMFGPACYMMRRKDGVPSVLEDHYFGDKIRVIEEGFLMERWNTMEAKDLPDFDVCLYDPDTDKLRPLTNIKCFDWHLAEREENLLFFKWFDGTQGGEVQVAL